MWIYANAIEISRKSLQNGMVGWSNAVFNFKTRFKTFTEWIIIQFSYNFCEKFKKIVRKAYQFWVFRHRNHISSKPFSMPSVSLPSSKRREETTTILRNKRKSIEAHGEKSLDGPRSSNGAFKVRDGHWYNTKAPSFDFQRKAGRKTAIWFPFQKFLRNGLSTSKYANHLIYLRKAALTDFML